MEKDFDAWNEKKKAIHHGNKAKPCTEREIWHCFVGANIGFEEDGKGSEFLRPIIIFRRFNEDMVWVIPLTRTQKKKKYYFEFSFDSSILSVAILSQIKLIDARRLKRRIGVISKLDFDELKQKFRALLP